MFADLFDEGDGDGQDEAAAAAVSGSALKVPKPPAPRSSGGFVGLQNQGSTCYMNALLQVMYMTPELRAGLFQVDPNELGFADIMEAEREAIDAAASTPAVLVARPAPDVDASHLQMLMDMGFDEHGSRRALLAAKGGGVDGALNYYLEHSEDPGFLDPPAGTAAVASSAAPIVGGKKKRKPRLIPLELQRLFSQLQLLDVFAQSTTDLTSKGFQWEGVDGRVQHDAHELNRLLLDALEKSLKHTSGEKLCPSLYRGELANRIQCLQCGTVKDRREEYFDLMTQVLGCPDMAASMRTYLAAELLEGDNAYACEVCGFKCPAHKGTVVLEPLPPILSFSLQRFDIDRRTWERVKVKSSFEFPLTINMSQFVENGCVANRLNNPLATDPDVEAEILQQVRGGMVWLGDAVTLAMSRAAELVERHYLGAMDPPSDTTEGDSAGDHIGVMAARVLSAVPSVDIAYINNSLLQTLSSAGGKASLYDLFAVITHCGSAYSGHYFAYVRDCFGTGTWRMPRDTSGSRAGKVTVASADPEKTKSSTSVQDQYRERSRAELVGVGASKARFVVNSDSPLGLLLRIILEEGSDLPKEFYQTHELKNASPTHMPIGRMGASVKKHIKRTWKDSFSIGITEFIKKMPSDLVSYMGAKDSFVVWDVSIIEFLDAQTFVATAPNKPSIAAVMVTSPDAATSDEALALEPSRQLNDKEGMDGKHYTDASDAGEWEVVGDKKQKRGTDKLEAIPGEASVDVAATAATAAMEVEEWHKNRMTAVIEEVGNRLLNGVFGEFWEFNDSSVTPICLSTLSKAFESTNSAYILVYRHRESSGGLGKSAVPEAPRQWVGKVQAENECLAEKRAEYEEYVRVSQAGTIDLCVRCPVHIRTDSSGGALLTLRAGETSLEWIDGLFLRCTNATTLEELKVFVVEKLGSNAKAYGVTVQLTSAVPGSTVGAWEAGTQSLVAKMEALGKSIDPSSPGAAVFSALCARGGGIGWYPTDVIELVAAKNEKLSHRRAGTAPKAVLSYSNMTLGQIADSLSASSAQLLDVPLYPSSVVSENGRIVVLTSEPITSDTPSGTSKNPPARALALNLLLWNDSMIDQAAVLSGVMHEPRLFSIKLLAPVEALSGEVVTGRPRVVWERDMWINASVTVASLCDRVLNWVAEMSAQYPEQLISEFGKVPSNLQSVYVIETYGALKNHPKAHAKGIYAKLLYDGESSSMVRAVKKDSTVKDLQGSELIVECSLKRGLSVASLAEIEATFRNNEIDVNFEFDEKLIRVLKVWPSHDVQSASVAVMGAGKLASKVSVDYTQTLRDLKRRMLQQACVVTLTCLSASVDHSDGEIDAMGESILGLCVKEFLDRVRIRINPDLAGIMNDDDIDESKVASATFKSGDVLFLELGEPRVLGSIMLQCIPVFGNDIAIKRNPKQSGVKVAHLKLEQTFAIDKDSTVSIFDVRMSFLAAFNAIIGDESLALGGLTLLDENNTRLRTTNWAEEESEMPLGEMSSTLHVPLLLSAVVSSGLIKSNGLLLLEAGKPPVPGMIDLNIYLDTRQMALFSSALVVADDISIASESCTFKTFVGNLSCELDTPLLSLQEQVLDLCRSRLPDVYKKRVQMHCGTVEVPEAVEQGSAGDYSAYGVEIPSSIENFVMRELRDDVDAMPGRCLWVRGGPLVAVAELETPVMPTVAVSSKKAVPVKRGGGKKASFSSGLVAVSAACAAPSAITKSTIRRSKLSSGSRCLIVQLLPAGIAHSASIGSDGAMRLWVFRGTPAASSRLYFGRPIDGAARDKLHCPEGDPVEVNLSGGPVPTLPQLKRAIERDLLVPFHSQRVFKLFHTDHVWRDLDAIGAKRKTVKGSDSLLAVPYSLKDGDMLCVIDCGATSGQTPVAFGAHVETKAAVEFIVDRPVDEMRRQHASSGGVDKGKKKKQSRQEIGLRLAGDFDFSDDEDGIES